MHVFQYLSVPKSCIVGVVPVDSTYQNVLCVFSSAIQESAEVWRLVVSIDWGAGLRVDILVVTAQL